MSWRVFWIIALLAGVSVVITASLFAPAILAQNTFLVNFVNHELLAMLVVIVTITFASVANIELALNRMQRRIVDAAKRQQIADEFATPLRLEIRSSARLLFWTLAFAVLVVLVKGQWPANAYVLSLAHGASILIVVTNGVVLYDLYETSFALIENDDG